MLCLMKNENAYKKLMYEIDDAIRAGKVPTGPEEVVSDSQAEKLGCETDETGHKWGNR